MNIDADYIELPKDEVLKMPLPLPYNKKEYTEKDIQKFINKTINNSKQSIIIFGGNWCGDCRVLAGTFNLPTIKKFLDKHYEVLHIDVGRYEINMNLMEYFNIPIEEGVPRVLVFDKNNNLLNSSSTKEWTTARDRKQQEIFNYFQDLVAD
jgi:thiol-disulfide isomerase/thioredoxin